MRVKIGLKIFDSCVEPIVLVLSDEDKVNIANMLPECHKYCSYPDEGFSEDEIRAFMEIEA